MKYALSAICFGILFFTACKENDAPLAYPKPSIDSTYVLPAGSIPAPDAHNVYVEEFTGQSCSNCPAAHSTLETIAATGNVNVAGLYLNGFAQAVPPPGHAYDFRDSSATLIGSGVYGAISGIPSGGVDRVPVGGSMVLYQSDWSAAITARKAITDSVNLAVESSFSGGVGEIKATITYLKPMSTQQNLSIIVVEDSMVDLQEFPTTVQSGYVFTNVFRDMVTAAPYGEPILGTMAVKEAGRVYWRKYKYIPKSTANVPFVPEHCHVIALVNAPGTGGDFHVLQSVKVNLVP